MDNYPKNVDDDAEVLDRLIKDVLDNIFLDYIIDKIVDRYGVDQVKRSLDNHVERANNKT